MSKKFSPLATFSPYQVVQMLDGADGHDAHIYYSECAEAVRKESGATYEELAHSLNIGKKDLVDLERGYYDGDWWWEWHQVYWGWYAVCAHRAYLAKHVLGGKK